MDHQHRRSNDATVPSPLSDSHRHADMGSIYSSVPAQPKKATTSLNDLQDDLLLNVLQHLSVRDVEAVAIASKHVAHGVIPKFPVWKSLFCHRWTSLNFPLRTHDTTGVVPIDIDPRLRALFPPECSESRMYQLLTHAVTPVPSYVDVRETERARFFSTLDHAIEAVGDPPRRQTLDVAYAGAMLGGDRCVRSNTPFTPMFRVQVYALHTDASRKTIEYRVGVVASGYFEISIRDPPRRRSVMMTRRYGDDVTSIGLGDRSFPLTTKQPGWDGHSIGYHGDDGNLFKRSTRGRPFAVPFGVGDTVGCGVRHDFDSPTSSSFAYFTNNGDLIPTGDRMIELPQNEWYPVVGLDSLNVIHFNFGQEPFVCTAAVDALFRECEGQQAILATQLQWYNISDSDCESESDSVSSLGRSSESDSDLSGGEFERMYDHVPEFSAFINELISDMMDDESEASGVEGSTDVVPDDEAFSP